MNQVGAYSSLLPTTTNAAACPFACPSSFRQCLLIATTHLAAVHTCRVQNVILPPEARRIVNGHNLGTGIMGDQRGQTPSSPSPFCFELPQFTALCRQGSAAVADGASTRPVRPAAKKPQRSCFASCCRSFCCCGAKRAIGGAKVR